MPATAVAGLEPADVWGYFEALTQIPRPSKHEGRVLQYLKDFAAQHGLQWQQDAVGNLVVRRPGSGGGQAAPTVVIQGHVDMVCEKNSDVAHDFQRDPLRLVRQDGWLKAEGTTLGADNGIGVAAALALLASPPSATLPPLEGLFTVDEETGLTGAFGLDGSLVTGRTLLNLDTEDWGEIFIGCAGGGDSQLSLMVFLEPAPCDGVTPLRLAVSGLMGGHSGLNINEDRGNAVAMAARIVDAVLQAAPGTRITHLKGGDKRNAIPRECAADLLVPSERMAEVRAVIQAQTAALTAEYGTKETAMAISAAEGGAACPGTCLAAESASRLIALLRTLPHGVIKYSHAVPGLVETSTNLAALAPVAEGASATQATYRVTCSTRSSLMPALEAVRGSIAKVAALCGADVEADTAYPGWAPDLSSSVLQVTREVFSEVLGREPKVGAIHAGLECGILGERVPGMDMVSYGPTIRGAHSPDEKVDIATVAQFWDVTLRILHRLAQRRA